MIGTSLPLAPSGNPHRDTTLIGPKFFVSMSILKKMERHNLQKKTERHIFSLSRLQIFETKQSLPGSLIPLVHWADPIRSKCCSVSFFPFCFQMAGCVCCVLLYIYINSLCHHLHMFWTCDVNYILPFGAKLEVMVF